MQQIQDRIKKIKGLADRAGTQGEAEAAIIAMQRLMDRYGLAEVDLLDDEEEKTVEDVVVDDLAKRVDWKNRLAMVIARNFRCDIYNSPYRRKDQRRLAITYKMIGMTNDVKLAYETYHLAVETAERLWVDYREEEKRERFLSRSDIKLMRTSWLGGFVNGLQQAFHEQVKGDGMEMVLVKDEAVTEYTSSLGLKKSRRSAASYGSDWHARSHGQRSGHAFGQGNRGHQVEE